MAPIPDDLRTAVGAVVEPALGRTLGELGLVRHVDRDLVVVGLAAHDHPRADELGAAVAAVAGGARVELEPLDEDDQAALVERVGPGDGIPFGEPGSRTRVVLVASGKGGVGKSSVTVNLAIALAQRGKRVAVVDADVWGFSVPAMLGLERPPAIVGKRLILPPAAHGVAVASIGFFVREDQPVVWRGPMLHKALEQFLSDFWWGDPDYLVVDLPPGTGDISISIAQFLPSAEAYVVTTPQAAAQRVAQRAGLMFQTPNIKIPVRGVVENMAWFTGDDGKRYELFGAGGGAELAERLEVPLVGQVPLVPALREGGDEGVPITVRSPSSESAQAFASIAAWVDEHPPTKRRHPGLKLA